MEKKPRTKRLVPKVRFMVDLDPSIYDRLYDTASGQGIPINRFVVEAIERHLKEV